MWQYRVSILLLLSYLQLVFVFLQKRLSVPTHRGMCPCIIRVMQVRVEKMKSHRSPISPGDEEREVYGVEESKSEAVQLSSDSESESIIGLG